MSKHTREPLTAADIKKDHIYSAKRPKYIGALDRHALLNDRQVIWIDSYALLVQYDSPTVAGGRSYPIVSMAKFLKWADEDVTEKMPKGEWRTKKLGA